MSASPLQVEQLSCGFAGTATTPLLSGLNLELAPGEAVAVVGPNGVGKTTLLRTLAGLLPLLQGAVRLGGEDLTRLSGVERARRLAMLTQVGSGEESLSVRELVELGRTPYLGLFGRLGPEDHQAVDHALTACHLEALAERRLDRLSGGERQRARIALTVAQQTDLLLLDEPVNHLDLRRRHEFYGLVSQLRKERGLAVVYVLHDLAEAFREAQRVFVLSGGQAALVRPDDPQRRSKLAEAFEVPEDRVPAV
jgi:iron complex transport system ATP-binding protein